MGRRDTAALCEGMVETMAFPAAACGPDGTVLAINAAGRSLWPETIVGQAALTELAVFDENGASPLDAEHPLKRALGGQQTAGPYRAGEDSQRWVLTATPLRAKNGAVLGASMILEPVAGDAVSVEEYASDIQTLGEVSRTLSAVEDSDEAAAIISTVTLGSTGACAVLLWHADADGGITLSHEENVLESSVLNALKAQAHAGARQAIAKTQAHIDQNPERSLTLWHEPLIYGGTIIGALSVIWDGLLFDQSDGQYVLSERLRNLIALLAQQAAVALERSKLLRALSDAARLDALTGLANRREWAGALERECKRARRNGTPLSLLLLDIDFFKRYNDGYGHPAGDRLLAEASQSWAEHMREVDVLARLGGEEFAVILPDCDIAGAVAVAERLRAAMPHDQTCSLGACAWDGSMHPDEFYALTDQALYDAKQGGRDRVCVRDPIGAPAA